jgi:glycosyltransferase involved in cell wall biosynthesis
MREQGYAARGVVKWTGRSALHHSSRKAAEILGSRHERLPRTVQRAMSLEKRPTAPRVAAPPPEPAQTAPRGEHVPAGGTTPYRPILEASRRGGPEPLLPALAGRADRERLHLAFVIPFFARGSGGQNTISQTIRRLEDMGHTCTVWMHDPPSRNRGRRAATIRHEIREWFAPVRAPVFIEFEDWHGADVAVATGWETAHVTAGLPGCAARAYLVNDHEPEFFGTSVESLWAEETYRLGLFPISASPWLRDLIAERYGSQGTAFRLGVDHKTYWPGQVERRDDTVIVYARAATARRAVPLALLALEELKARRPDLRVILFGQTDPARVGFDYEQLGVATPGQLALNYCEATVGICLSLTNYSLIPQEMMACGLPCVDLGGGSSEAVFGSDGPAQFAQPDPLALADATEALLTDRELWTRRSEAGIQFVADADWDETAREIESGLREALRVREHSGAATG